METKSNVRIIVSQETMNELLALAEINSEVNRLLDYMYVRELI